MRFCDNCGSEIKDGDEFCSLCGKPIENGNIGKTERGVKVAKKDRKEVWYIYNWKRIFNKIWKGVELKHHVLWIGIHCGVIFLVALLFAFILLKISSDNYAEIENEVDDEIDDELADVDNSYFVDIHTGDIVTLGHYEQDNNMSNGKEEIEWEVLDVVDNKALLVSKYLLEGMKYSDSSDDTSWETSFLRKWMNEDFYNESFDDDEKEYILLSEHQNENGNRTEDRVFALGLDDEINKYFSYDYSFESANKGILDSPLKICKKAIVDATPYVSASCDIYSNSINEDYIVALDSFISRNREALSDRDIERAEIFKEDIENNIGLTGYMWWLRDGYAVTFNSINSPDPGTKIHHYFCTEEFGIRPAIWVSVK